MSQTKNIHKLSDKSRTDAQADDKQGEGHVITTAPENRTYAVTVSKKPSPSGEEEALCSTQKSFISIHSTDHLCQVAVDNPSIPEECNVEVLSRNEVFPSTSEESLSNDEITVQKKQKKVNKSQKMHSENPGKSSYAPTSSKSSVMSARPKDPGEMQTSVYSDFDIPKSTMYVLGSNPGEPKMFYPDTPKKISKTMKKFLRTIDKHKNDQNSKHSHKVLGKLITMRGILKSVPCGPECTGDSSAQGAEDINPPDLTLPFPMDFEPYTNYVNQNLDKNVTFNKQVMVIHFTGDLCVGQSVETLSKEKDQQARNSELRKTFLTKYNEFWPTHK